MSMDRLMDAARRYEPQSSDFIKSMRYSLPSLPTLEGINFSCLEEAGKSYTVDMATLINPPRGSMSIEMPGYRTFHDLQRDPALSQGWFIPGLPLVLRLVHELYRCRVAKPTQQQRQQIEHAEKFLAGLIQGQGLQTGTIIDYNEKGCLVEQTTLEGRRILDMSLYGPTTQLPRSRPAVPLMPSGVPASTVDYAIRSVAGAMKLSTCSDVMMDAHCDFSSVKRMAVPEGECQTRAITTITLERTTVMVSLCGLPHKPRHWLLASVKEKERFY